MTSATSQAPRSEAHIITADSPAETHNNSLTELAKGFPDETVGYLKSSLLVGGFCGILVAFPSAALLFFEWERCALCEKPFRLWLVIAALLHFVQAPLRFGCFQRLASGARVSASALGQQSDDELQHRQQVCALIASIVKTRSWRVSQAASGVSLGWFLVGAVWVLSTSPSQQGCPEAWYLTLLVLMLAGIKIVVSIVFFRLTFCSDIARAALASQVERSSSPDKTCGANPARLEEFLSPVCDDAYSTEESGCHCSVCLSNFHKGQRLRVLPCGHYFHQACVDQWLMKTCACPLCRSDESNWAAAKAKHL